MTPDLASYDYVVVNTSGGKDSQTALRYVALLAEKQDVLSHVVESSCRLGDNGMAGNKRVSQRPSGALWHYLLRGRLSLSDRINPYPARLRAPAREVAEQQRTVLHQRL